MSGKRGVTVVVEVDGESFHRETPAAAQERLLMLENEGLRVFRLNASECATPEAAKQAAGSGPS